MNLKTNISLLFTVILLLTSCKKELKIQENPSFKDSPINENIKQEINTTTSTLNNATTLVPKVNPPHGQSGHRCDIQVGAPLNTPSGSAAVQQINVSQPAVNETPPGMNPPHGEPGHRCDIPAGNPLPK